MLLFGWLGVDYGSTDYYNRRAFFVAGLLWAALWQMNKHNKT
jgi:hypothetical protein